MHYGDGFASKNDEKTLVPKDSGVSQKIKNKQISEIILHVAVFHTSPRLILIVTTLITRCEVAAESGGEAGRQISH